MGRVETGVSFFGLPVFEGRLIRESDIAKLPFYDFWRESARGSTQPIFDDETYVYLHDWEAFCRLFIKTGKHRYCDGDRS